MYRKMYAFKMDSQLYTGTIHCLFLYFRKQCDLFSLSKHDLAFQLNFTVNLKRHKLSHVHIVEFNVNLRRKEVYLFSLNS